MAGYKKGILPTEIFVHTLNLRNIIPVYANASLSWPYEGCSNMNASSFITFFTCMLQQIGIPFWKELFVAFKMAPNINNNHFISRVTDPYIKAIPVYWSFSEANCITRFGTCADIVSYLCKFKTKRHQNLDASLRYINKVLSCFHLE